MTRLSEQLEALLVKYPDDPEQGLLKMAIREMRKRERSVEGFSHGRIEKIKRRVARRVKDNVPYALWDDEEQWVYAIEIKGLACPSGSVLEGFQVTETKKKSEIQG